MSAQVGVLALQGGVAEHLAALDRLQVPAKPITEAADLDRIGALIIPGGESTTMQRLLCTNDLRDPVASLMAAGLPVFGTCAGLVLLARRVLDEEDDHFRLPAVDITVRRNAYGGQRASFEAELALSADMPDAHRGFPGVFIRAPRLVADGASVQVIARLPDGQPVAVRGGPILATTFHPELTDDDRLHRYFLGQVAGLDRLLPQPS